MKLIVLTSLLFLTSCATRYEKELTKVYPQHFWPSANIRGLMDTNYNKSDVLIEPASGDGPPSGYNPVWLPVSESVVYSYPGRYLFLKKGRKWYKFRVQADFKDIEELGETEYTRMLTWGDNNMIVGGFKADGSLDVITTYTGAVVTNLQDVDPEAPRASAHNAAFVRLKNGVFRHILAHKKRGQARDGDWYEYTTHFSLSPHTYLFAGEIQNISLAIRELDGGAYTEIFYKGAVVDFSKNRESAQSVRNKAYMAEQKDLEYLDFGAEPERRFVILRDGEITPSAFKALDGEKLQNLIPMRLATGTPRALGILFPNEKGEARIHSLSFYDYALPDNRTFRSGTFTRSLFGAKDAMGTYYVNTYNYQEHPVIIFQEEDGKWNWGAGDLRRENESTGVAMRGVEKEALPSMGDVLAVVRKKCGTFGKTPHAVAKLRLQAEERAYKMAMGAQAAYEDALKQDEYRRKLSAYEAEQAQRREFQEALGSITSSLSRGATSNTPKGPKGFDDRYNSTGDGWNRYQKYIEKEARRKARPGQN